MSETPAAISSSTVNMIKEPFVDPSIFARANNLLAVAKDVKVPTTEDEYREVADMLTSIKSFQKDIEAVRMDQVKPLNGVISAFNKMFKKPKETAVQAEKVLKDALLAYQKEQDRKRLEEEERVRAAHLAEQAKIREAAEKREAAEREKARVAREKAEAEAAKLAEQGRAEAAEAARKLAAEREAERVAAAEREAEAKREAAAYVPPAVVSTTATAPKVSGIVKKTVWTFEILDLSLVPDEYKTLNEKMIGGVVKAMKGKTNIPGVRAYETEQIAAGGR